MALAFYSPSEDLPRSDKRDNKRMSKATTVDALLGRQIASLRLVREAGSEKVQMTPQMWSLFLEIARKPGLTQQELADRSDMSLSSISRNLMALGEFHRSGEPGMNIVEQIEDPIERRRKIAFLTVKGRTFAKKMLAALYPEHEEEFDAPTATEWLNAGQRFRR